MKHRGAFTVFATAFAVVLIGGLALAQVGVLRPAADAPGSDPAIATTAEPTAPAASTAAVAAAVEIASTTGDAGPGTEPAAPAAPHSSNDPEDADGDDTGDRVGDSEGSGGDDEGKGEGGDDPDTTPPDIEVLHPEEGQVFHEKIIAFEGKSEPWASVTAGRYEADVDAEGHWRIRLVLNEGRNLARFVATDAAGNTAEATVTVIYEPKTEEPPAVEFSAHQQKGSSSANPPYDVFWGTARPGAKITIASDFGGKQLTANSKGGWEAKVYFEGAPIGKAFRVVIESSDGGRKVFEFVRKGDEVTHEFTANQTYGSCGEDIPYDVFYGRADAGERIWVESRYGSGVTEATAHGHWELEVEFPEAPVGKVFEVVVEAEHGGRKTFTFVNTGGEGK